MKGTVNRCTIALLSVIMVCLLAVPAMANNLDDLETRCWNNTCLNGTITNGSVIVLENPGSVTSNWTITLPNGTVNMSYVHIWTYGHCDGNPTAEFWNATGAHESIYFNPNNLPTDRTKTSGVWWAEWSPSNTHYYWKVNATPGVNTFKATGCGGPAYDGSWFVAVMDNVVGAENITHTGHWWHNTGYRKTFDNDTDYTSTHFYNDPVGDPLNTDANYTLWTVQTHFSAPPIYFNGKNLGIVGHEGLEEWNVDNVDADGDQFLKFGCEDPGCDEYYVYFGTLAEKISSQVPKPDLVVEDIIFPEVMKPNTNYTIKARIKNQGDAGTENTSNVSLNVDSHSGKVTDVGPLGAGASTTVNFTNVSLEDGCHKFTVTADCDSNVSESNENNNATSEWYQVGNVIVVHNNSDLRNHSDFINRSGTYYLENRTITNCAGCGITIENTTLPFVIQNCTVHDCNCKAAAPDPAGIFLHNVTNGKIGDYSNRNTIENNTNAGIRVKNSTYVDITDNTIRNNTLYGIYAYPRALPATPETRDDCKYINVTNNTVTENVEAVDLIAYNCTVKNNTITDNTLYGIYMMGNYSNITDNNVTNSTDYGLKLYNCSGNYVYENNFTDNKASNLGHQAWDNGNNYWNTTEKGNWWSDWVNNTGYSNGTYEIDGGDNKDSKADGPHPTTTTVEVHSAEAVDNGDHTDVTGDVNQSGGTWAIIGAGQGDQEPYVQVNFSTNITAGSINSVIFYYRHYEDSAIDWVRIYVYDNGNWDSYVDGAVNTTWTTDTADLTEYIGTETEAENVKVRYEIHNNGQVKDGNLDYAYLNITYTQPS